MSAPGLSVITGASRGIGRCFAQSLAKRGGPLLLAARSAAGLQEVADGLRRPGGGEVRVVATDLSCPDGVDTLVAACGAQPVAHLINNAGVGLGGPLAGQDPQRLAALVYLNVVAPTRITRALVGNLAAARGAVVQVASTAGFQPMPNIAAYAASKAYMVSLAIALYHELAAQGIHVMALCPGPTATDFFDQADWHPPLADGRLPSAQRVVDAALAGLARRQPLVVEGWKNRALMLCARLASPSLVARLAARVGGTASSR